MRPHSRGRKNVQISFQAGPLFFPRSLSISVEAGRTTAKSETSKDGLIEPPGNVLHFILRRGPRSRIFIAHRAVNACRFSRVFRISTTTTVGRASEFS